MNFQQAVQPRSANGFGRRKVEKETGNRADNKLVTGKTNSGRLTTGGENSDLIICIFFESLSF